MNKKRFCLLAAVLLLMVLPWHTATAESVTGGALTETITWDFQDGTLTISGTGIMEYTASKQPPWYHLRGEITTVIVEEGIEVIGYSAFENCVNLTHVQLPSTLKRIGHDAFKNCQSLEQITLPSGLQRISENVFEYCTNLKSITIPDTVEKLGGSLFKNCYSLETVILPSALEEIPPYAFSGCRALRAITLPESVKKIRWYAFHGCQNLTDVTLSKKLSSVGEGAFDSCTSLARLDFFGNYLNFDKNVFHNCDSLMLIRFWGDFPGYEYPLFDEREPDEPPCVIAYPADNETWTERKMQRMETQYGAAIQLAPDGVVPCEHVAVTIAGKEATCTEEGLTAGKYCSLCGDVLKKQKKVDALGHDLVTTTVPPTCLEPGYDLHTCSRCQFSQTDNPVDATGHTFDEWQTVKEPTVEEVGLEARKCRSCEVTEQRELGKLPPPPTQPPTEPPTNPPTQPVPTQTTPVPTQFQPPAPKERAEAGVGIVLILFAVAAVIVAVKWLTKKRI